MRMTKGNTIGLLLGLMTFLAVMAQAAVKPNGLISDGAVLQQGRRVPIWGTCNPGQKVTVAFQDQMVLTDAPDGKWIVWLKPLRAGGPFTMTISGEDTVTVQNLLVGEVYVCSGQSNMEWPLSLAANAQEAIAQSNDPMLRLFTTPYTIADSPQHEVSGQWKECGPDTVKNFSAVAYFFGRDLRHALNVPVGLIQSGWGGTPAEAWTRHEALEAEPSLHSILANYDRSVADYQTALKAYQDAQDRYKAEADRAKQEGKEPPKPPSPPGDPHNSNSPSVLYNSKIAPLIPYGIRGVIWYQGESNAGRAYEYQTLFPTMIRNWRADWGEGDIPFFFVQLAPFLAIKPEPQESAWAELREAQRLTLRLPHTGMAVITDVGDEKDIHPRRKEPVGHRLALAALALVYGQHDEYSGPTFDSMRIQGNRAVLRFRHAQEGLVAQGGELTGFTIAGPDHKWVNAHAEIQGDRVVVSSPEVAHPVAVRFGWADYPVVNLTNRAGLPASPFRTDNFPLTTQPH